MSSSHPTNNIIAGTLRTLVQLVPMAGGAIAQAWTEYESFHQNRRTEEFFLQLTEHLRRLETGNRDLRVSIEAMPDAAELMEKAVAAVKRETSDPKRQIYSRFYSNFLENPSTTTPEERADLIHHLEQLTEGDLRLLNRFAGRSGTLRGDMITDTIHTDWAPIGQQDPDPAWLERHGDTVHSVAKLVARGLIHDAVINAGFGYSGDASSSFNRFRSKAWTITPMGRKLLQAIKI